MKKKKLISSIFILIIFLTLGLIILIPTINNTKFGLDLQGGFEVLYQVQSIDGSKVTNDMLISTYQTISKRIDVLGVTEPEIIIEGEDKIRVGLAGITNAREAREILSQAANLTFRDTSDNLLMSADVLRSGGAKFTTDTYGKPAVALSIKDIDQFYKVTKEISERTDNRIVIWLDYDNTNSFEQEEIKCGKDNSNCLSAAKVPEGFTNDVIITGNFTESEVKTLVNLINSGSLSTKLNEISSKTVESSFGADSLQKTIFAGMIGISLIFVFLTVIYHLSGFIAAISLVLYTAITMFVFWLIGGVLTLPGIAALLIGIGMAVDTSVINFSRIKDELRNGNNLNDSFVKGNQSSFLTILDSNITTLIVALVLFILGQSSVKGFATMLIISIVTTIFIMFFFAKWLLSLFVKTNLFNNKLNLFLGLNKKKTKQQYHINFIKYKNKFYVIIGSIIIIGIISVILKGLNLGIDFKGGSSISLKTDMVITEEDIKNTLSNYNIYNYEKYTNIVNIKITQTLSKDEILQLETTLNEKYEANTDIGVVSNIVKKELIKNAFIAVIVASIEVCIYVAFRFKFSYSVSGILALMHDAFIVVALFSLLKLEVSSIFIAAILSIIGYSINDTIVIFDRIRETVKIKYKNKIKNKEELSDAVNESLNLNLNRTIMTTLTTLFPVVSLIIFGSREILNFNLALLFGFVGGVFSTLFIAPMIWYEIERKNIGKPIKKRWVDEEPEEYKVKGINY